MKFKLTESTINEVYSPSMPPALKAYLGKQYKGERNYKVDRLLNLGIDVNKANFKEVPIPTTNRDPFFKLEGVTKIYDFGNGLLYIQGINDDTEFVRSDGKWQPAKYLPAKEIMALSKHIYTVDPQETAGELQKTKVTRSTNRRNEVPNKRFTSKEMKRMGYQQYMPGRSGNRWTTYVDKSGYIVDPSRLAKKIAELGIFKPEKKIAKLHDEILLTRNNIAATFEDFSESGRMDVELLNNMKSAISNLSDAAYYYNQIQDRLDEMERYKARNNGALPADRLRGYKQTVDSYIQSSTNCVNRATGDIKQYLGTLVDWDTDEDDI